MHLRDVNHTRLATEKHVVVQQDYSFEGINVTVVIGCCPPIGSGALVNFFDETHFRLCRKPDAAVSLIQRASLTNQRT